MKFFKKLILFLAWAILFHPSLIHSQSLTASNLTLLVTELSNTPPITVDGLPSFALFYSAQNPANPPLPGNPNQLSAWLIATNTYLLDDLDFDYSAWAQAHSQAMGRLRGGGGGGWAMDAPGGFGGYSFSTNGLWLQITNVTNGLAYLNLNNATDTVYEIMTKTDLTLTNWTIEAEVWPTNATVMPFTLEQSGRTNLFVWAMDWTGVTENGNTTPDWWFWQYFGLAVFPNGNGSLTLSDSTLDSRGVNTYLFDYQNGVDPNVIGFSLAATNNYVATATAGLQLNVSSGTPDYYAIAVDDANYVADANWQTYSGTNITAVVGLTEGWHNVWVGLRGLPANATQTWACKRIKVDFTPPTMVITNPTTGNFSVPLAQLQGYCPEELAAISYDLSNSVGIWTNLHAGICGQVYSTNTWEFTTNYFHCVDVPLTNGLNLITLHATDRAGNSSSTNISLTLDYSSRTNPPVVNLYWPQNGAQIGNSNFTWRGWVDDPTASVVAQQVDTNGVTNVFYGLVERDGNFWVENLTLTCTNYLTLFVTDSAGNVASTNITVSPSPLAVSINAPDPSTVWNPTVTVTGTISDSSDYTLWVNGVLATLNGDGTWTAAHAPLPKGGTTLIQARAIPNALTGTGGNGGAPVAYDNLGNPTSTANNDTESQVDKPAFVYVQSYDESDTSSATWQETDFDIYGNPTGYAALDIRTSSYNVNWQNNSPGQANGHSHEEFSSSLSPTIITNDTLVSIAWPASSWPDIALGTVTETGYGSDDYITTAGSPIIWEHCELGSPLIDTSGAYLYPPGDIVEDTAVLIDQQDTGTRHAQAQIKFKTGGKGASSRKNLFGFTASASAFVSWKAPPPYEGATPPVPPVIAPASIKIGSLGALGNDGNLYKILADNSEEDITPKVEGVDYYSFSVSAQKFSCEFTAFVDMPGPPPSHATHVGLDFGHAWWEFTTDAPAEAVEKFSISGDINFMNIEVGYADSGHPFGHPGLLRYPESDTNKTETKTYVIGFTDFVKGIEYTRALYNNPGTYNVLLNNCVEKVIAAGAAAGVNLPNDTQPETFGWDLINSP